MINIKGLLAIIGCVILLLIGMVCLAGGIGLIGLNTSKAAITLIIAMTMIIASLMMIGRMSRS